MLLVPGFHVNARFLKKIFGSHSAGGRREKYISQFLVKFFKINKCDINDSCDNEYILFTKLCTVVELKMWIKVWPSTSLVGS